MKKILLSLAAVCCLGGAAAAKQPLYKNRKAPIERRVEDLLARMTLHEKVLQLQNREAGKLGELEDRFHGESVGTVHEMGHDAAECQRIIGELQEYMFTKTRLGIPALTCVCLLYTSPSPRD